MPTKNIVNDHHLEVEDQISNDQESSFELDQIYGSPQAKNPSKDFSKTPMYILAESGNVTAKLGETAYLNCRVRGIRYETVSWVRHEDTHLLTIGR